MAAININEEQFNKLISEEKPVLVDFWAPWCGYCHKIKEAYDEIADEYKDSLVVAKVNIDDEPKLADAEQIHTIPTLVLYKNKESVASVVAPKTKDMIYEFLNEALEK